MDPLCQEWVQQESADDMKLQQLSPVIAKFHPSGPEMGEGCLVEKETRSEVKSNLHMDIKALAVCPKRYLPGPVPSVSLAMSP